MFSTIQPLNQRSTAPTQHSEHQHSAHKLQHDWPLPLAPPTPASTAPWHLGILIIIKKMTQNRGRTKLLKFEEIFDGSWPHTSREYSIGSKEGSGCVCHHQKPGRGMGGTQKGLWKIWTLQHVTIEMGHVTHQACHQHMGNCDSQDFDPTEYTRRLPVAFVVQEVTPTKP